MVSFIKMLFRLIRLCEFLPNNKEIETICYDLFKNYINKIQDSVYSELLNHIKGFNQATSLISTLNF